MNTLSGTRPKGSLLKWVGSKYRFAETIIELVPDDYETFYEPFVGSAAVTATLCPEKGFASDAYRPVIDIWKRVRDKPGDVCRWYEERIHEYENGDREEVYYRIRDRFNHKQNAADFLFLCRACYAGIIRFRKADGYMSTPIGPHKPIARETFASRVQEWHHRLQGVDFAALDFREAFARAGENDVVYCDPPYFDSQGILYGAQSFQVEVLLSEIQRAKSRGVRVILSIDGKKKSGKKKLPFEYTEGLFERELEIDCGRSMLRRLQMRDQTLENEQVADRLLLTF